MRNITAAVLLVAGFAVMASANPGAPVPEIDPGSIVAATALIGSAFVMLRRRPKA